MHTNVHDDCKGVHFFKPPLRTLGRRSDIFREPGLYFVKSKRTVSGDEAHGFERRDSEKRLANSLKHKILSDAGLSSTI